MCWDELDTMLGREHPDSRTSNKVIAFLRSGYGEAAARSLNPRVVARRINEPLHSVVRVFERATETGSLRKRFWLICPNLDAGVQWIEHANQIPQSYQCDLADCEDDEHEALPDNIEVRYAKHGTEEEPA